MSTDRVRSEKAKAWEQQRTQVQLNAGPVQTKAQIQTVFTSIYEYYDPGVNYS